MGKVFHMNERQFLNLPTNLRAYIIAFVEDSSPYPASCDQYREGGQIELRLADCYNEIDLYFDLSNARERRNSLHKAKTLAEILSRFHSAIETEVNAIEERETLKLHARAAASIH
jgi:hypothetical protein